MANHRWIPILVFLAGHVGFASADGQEPRQEPRVAMRGVAPKALAAVDELMDRYLIDKNAPGAALAIVKDGRLVLARGYGWADIERREPVEPDAKFRIASLSKSITAVGILQLVEQKKLAMDTKIYDLLDLGQYADTEEARARVDPRLKQVTIAQLLRHTGGFDRDDSLDPMFHSIEIARAMRTRPPASTTDIIAYMTTRPLDFTPGMDYAYSNFGYCLLGRAIEKATGKRYDEFIAEGILKPLGMRHTQLGKTLSADRAEGEVLYYAEGRVGPAVVGPIGRGVPLPYGAWYLEAMDSHGAWLSSAVDLARFLTAFDRTEDRNGDRNGDRPGGRPLLSAEMTKRMFARPNDAAGYRGEAPKRAYYTCGWMARGLESGTIYWHAGSLDGTAAIMVRRPGGVHWVALFNARSGPRGEHLADSLTAPLDRVTGQIETWPDIDLFESKDWK